MKPYNTQKNKLNQIYNSLVNNENNLIKKENIFNSQLIPSNIAKLPIQLINETYESAFYVSPDPQPDNPILTTYSNEIYAVENSIGYFQLIYNIIIEIPIETNNIEDVRTVFLIDKLPNIEPYLGENYKTYDSDYYRIEGDTTLLYKGTNPDKRMFTDLDVSNGDILSSHLANWFYGTLYYHDATYNYELRNSYIYAFYTKWDVSGAGFKSFEGNAIDNISSSSVTGTGHYIHSIYAGGGSSTKNITMTAPLFNDYTQIIASGDLYRNGIFIESYNFSPPLTITFDSSISGSNTLDNFDYIHREQIEGKEYKLFYSDKRAYELVPNTSYPYSNFNFTIPASTGYETGNLPYTEIYYYKNPSGYPEIVERNSKFSHGHITYQPLFFKDNSNKWYLKLSGSIDLQAPVTISVDPFQSPTQNDSYDQYFTTYYRYKPNVLNRTLKNLDRYQPEIPVITAKLLASYLPNIQSNNLKNFNN